MRSYTALVLCMLAVTLVGQIQLEIVAKKYTKPSSGLLKEILDKSELAWAKNHDLNALKKYLSLLDAHLVEKRLLYNGDKSKTAWMNRFYSEMI